MLHVDSDENVLVPNLISIFVSIMEAHDRSYNQFAVCDITS